MRPSPSSGDTRGPLPGGLSPEALLRTVSANARVGLVVVSPERRYLYVNATYAELLDLPSADIVGERLEDVLAAVYTEQVMPRLDQAFAGERVRYDLRRRTALGDRLLAVTYDPIVADGVVSSVVVVLVDVTESRRAGTEAHRLAAIVESSEDAIISKDLDGMVTSWNEGAERLFGFSADEMIGSPIMRIIPDDRRDEERKILERIRGNERIEHFETERRTKSGERITVSVAVSPIRDEHGRVVGASKVARDITARKEADEEMRFQQAMLLTEHDLTPDGILVVDAHSNVLSHNGRFAEMWGVDTEILETRADELLLDATREKLADPDEFMERVRELYERRDESSHDEVALADGRTFERHSAPMHDSAGRYYGRVWYFRDVTSRKRSEEALREERDRAQRYLDTAEVVLLALDPEGHVTAINRKGCELTGWTEDEMIGRSWIEACVPERMRGAITERFHEVLAGAERTVESPILTRGGKERMIEWKSRTIRDEDGSLVGTFSSGTDITERHQAQEALREAEERMRFALESASVGVWEVDYATGLARMTDVLEAQYGWKSGTFDGSLEGFLAGVHPDDRARVRAAVRKAEESGSDFTTEHRALWADGTVRWLTSAGRIYVDDDGAPVRGLGISIDVSEHHSLEQQYRQAQKMEAVGRLAGGIAHDFNNLLTAILGYCELLIFELAEDDPRRDDILQIRQAGESAARLTRQLLAFSRKQVVEPAVLDLNTIIEAMGEMLRRLIGEDVEIALNLGSGPMAVKVDPGQMEQVVMNLAVNARDAMPDGGVLTIETAAVVLDEDYAEAHLDVTPGPYVALTVSDTGAGMSAEVQERLFEPFFTTKEVGKGTGLGLATVHGIVTRGGGIVRVYSELGKGAAFTVYLPRSEGKRAAASDARRTRRPGTASETVLVVEDERRLRTLTKRMLERVGYTVLLAGTADEAVKVFDGNPSIDAVLTDVVMPRASGPELSDQLRERKPDLKVLYMSGYTADAISHQGILDPDVAFLHKPFTIEELERKLREVLDR